MELDPSLELSKGLEESHTSVMGFFSKARQQVCSHFAWVSNSIFHTGDAAPLCVPFARPDWLEERAGT